MGWWGRFWNLFYVRQAPWDIGGSRPELVRLVESGRYRIESSTLDPIIMSPSLPYYNTKMAEYSRCKNVPFLNILTYCLITIR